MPETAVSTAPMKILQNTTFLNSGSVDSISQTAAPKAANPKICTT